jgi:hypothetical protein
MIRGHIANLPSHNRTVNLAIRRLFEPLTRREQSNLTASKRGRHNPSPAIIEGTEDVFSVGADRHRTSCFFLDAVARRVRLEHPT